MDEVVRDPVKLDIFINGNGYYAGRLQSEPVAAISDELSQTILWHLYQTPRKVSELSEILNVPAQIIQACLKNLLYREAVTDAGDDKFQTDFVIFGDDVWEYKEEADATFCAAVGGYFIETLYDFTHAILKCGLYTAGKGFDELLYLFAVLALEHLSISHNPVPEILYKRRHDGNEWAYYAYGPRTRSLAGKGLALHYNSCDLDGMQYKHYSYHIARFDFRKPMEADHIAACVNILEGKPSAADQKGRISRLIADGYLATEPDGGLSVRMPYFNIEKINNFYCLADKYFEKIMPDYCENILKYVTGYLKLFPLHLHDDVLRMCNFNFVILFAAIAEYGRANDLLVAPPHGSFCDALVQSDI